MGFLYETHLHTCQASACGKVNGEDYIRYMMDKGFSGIVVTDHFFNGNTCVPADLPWNEKVEMYCSGYERALKAAKGLDFTVMLLSETSQCEKAVYYMISTIWKS